VSYAATLLVIVALVWWPLQKRRQLIEQQRRIQRINSASQNSSPSSDRED
jgi:heme exporter protein CcmD